MLLDLGDIMRHIVDKMHVEIVGRFVERLGEGLTRQKCHATSIDPGVLVKETIDSLKLCFVLNLFKIQNFRKMNHSLYLGMFNSLF